MIQTNNEDKTMNLTDFDTSKFKLGTLCKRGHDYEGTGQSLRYLRSIGLGGCVACTRESGAKRDISGRTKYMQEYRKNNIERMREKDRERYESNRDAKIEASKSWYRENKERSRIRSKQYMEKHKERIRIRKIIYNQKNREKNRIRHRAWCLANPNRVDESNVKRKTRLVRQSNGSITSQEIAKMLKDTVKCPYCMTRVESSDKHVDHMIPLSKGGLHATYNLAVVCSKCNHRKKDKTYPEWLDCLEPKQRKSAERLYYKRYGVSPIQGVLPLTFETEDKSDD